jgi:hypothetical protein
MLVLSCSNIRTELLVVIAALDLHLPILFLIGMSGLLLAFKLFNLFKTGFATLLSIGMGLLQLGHDEAGVQAIGLGTRIRRGRQVLRLLARCCFFPRHAATEGYPFVRRGRCGMLGEFPAMMSIAGLGGGTDVATYVLSSNLRGVQR